MGAFAHLYRIVPRRFRARRALGEAGKLLSERGLSVQYLDLGTGLYRQEDFSEMKEPSLIALSKDERELREAVKYLEGAVGEPFFVSVEGRSFSLPEEKRKFAPGYFAYEIKTK